MQLTLWQVASGLQLMLLLLLLLLLWMLVLVLVLVLPHLGQPRLC